MRGQLFLALVLIFSTTHAAADYDLTASLVVQNYTSLVITNFSMEPIYLPPSSPQVQFDADFYNAGNTVITYHTTVYIYNDSGDLVETVAFINSTIAGGERQSLNRVWTGTPASPGVYHAFVNATSPWSSSDTLNLTFTVGMVVSNASNISASGFGPLNATIGNGSAQHGDVYNGTYQVEIQSAGQPVVQFNFNFNSGVLNFAELNMSSGTIGDASYFSVSGIY